MTNIDKQTEDNFQERIIEMAKALSDLQDRAVIEYTPLVGVTCTFHPNISPRINLKNLRFSDFIVVLLSFFKK